MPPLFFKEQGSGPSIVFLHGFCETLEIWADFIEPFTKSHHVITLDLPGFGSSELLPTGFTIDTVGDKVAETIKQLNVKNACIVGHSLGGYVALSVLTNHPELVEGLVLFHSSAFADTLEKKENRNKVIEFVNNHGVQPFVDTFVPGLFFNKSNKAIPKVFEIASKTSKESLAGYSLAMRDRPDRRLIWTESHIRKLLIAGTEDTSIPIQISREMGRIGRNLTFYQSEKTGHMGFFEAKTECQQVITRFTNGLFSNN